MKKRTKTKIPRPKSKGEETLLLQIRAEGLPEPVRECRFDAVRDWRLDFYWPSLHPLAVEVEGGTYYGRSRHSTGDGFENDCRKYSAAALAGIRLLRFTTRQVMRGEAIEVLKGVFRG